MDADPIAERKRAAAEAAVALVEDGMSIGLGTGSTAYFAVEAVARRVREGLRIRAIPTSERTWAQAKASGIPLATFAECPRLDLTIDGADEIARGTLDLIKGLGGALLREKIVAAASARLVIIADSSKLVDRLGTRAKLPVEIVPFGWETTAARIAALGLQSEVRRASSGQPFLTDGGNMILDCSTGPIADPAALDLSLKRLVGVVETGLFVGRADRAIIAGQVGVAALSRA